jgi:hypothetical protein
MPKVPFTAWLGGPAAIYPTSTGQQDPITQLPYLGTDFQDGYFADLSYADAQVWNRSYVPPSPYGPGRYRIVKIASDAVVADILPNQPVGWALGSSVGSVAFTAGSGYTNGTYSISSSASGSQVAAVAQVVVSGGAIISASLVSGGSGFVTTSVPTFSLTALGGGSGGALTAQLIATGNMVTSMSSVSAGGVLSLPRGIALCNPGPTQAQVTAGAWIIIQELGIAPVLITTATSTSSGAQANGTTGGGGTVTTVTPGTFSALALGYALTPPVAGQVSPVLLTLPCIPS